MVAIRRVDDGEVGHARTLHNRFTDQEQSPDTIRSWYAAVPWLFLFAVEDDAVLGGCTGRPRGPRAVSLAGIGVEPDRRGDGIGTRLLEQFEANATTHGIDRISVASAGGRVDGFYRDNGYSPVKILVMNPGGGPSTYADTGFDLTWDRNDDGSRKCYVDVADHAAATLARVREVFDNEHAIYIMEKDLADR